MAKYLKLFENHNGYTAYTADTENYLLPNVSYCIEQNEVHFNPYNEPSQGLVLVATYTTTSSQEEIILIGHTWYDPEVGESYYQQGFCTDYLSKVEIDGVEVSVADLESSSGYFTFESSSDHTVNYTLKDNVTSIPYGTFCACNQLSSVILPDGIASISGFAFGICTTLTSVTIPTSVTSIGDDVFRECYALTSITIPNSVTSIGERAFSYCSSLTSITIPSGVTSLANALFYKCLILSSVTIPDGVTSIGGSAFNGCSGLTSVTIPSGVTNIGGYAFAFCSAVTSMTCLPTTPPTLESNAFWRVWFTIYVPSESVDAYKAASGWSTYASAIEPITN